MNLSISNIGWEAGNDDRVYSYMHDYGFSGLEIAPTRLFSENPYKKVIEAKEWSDSLFRSHGFVVSSMQSIWYGRPEKIFGTSEERETLLSYTKQAIEFAEAIGCRNLVFGCPGNRSIPEQADMEIAVSFFKAIGDYAAGHGTIIAMEANPSIYNTNFLNTTGDAIEFIETVDSKGFFLNLDVGTMIENEEEAGILKGKEHLINHIHISEPWLAPIRKRELHLELANMIRQAQYRGFVSIEVDCQNNISILAEMMDYVKNVFM